MKVKVLEVDLQRKRIALTMRLDEQRATPTRVVAETVALVTLSARPRKRQNRAGVMLSQRAIVR